MLEEERKYEVDPRFAVPDLSGCLPDGGEIVAAPPAPLRATYYDTADRRPARARAPRLLAELDDDTVAVLDGQRIRLRFREIEVERRAGGRRLLDRVDQVLRTAGANGSGFVPKHVRALGRLGPPELTPPAPALS